MVVGAHWAAAATRQHTNNNSRHTNHTGSHTRDNNKQSWDCGCVWVCGCVDVWDVGCGMMMQVDGGWKVDSGFDMGTKIQAAQNGRLSLVDGGLFTRR